MRVITTLVADPPWKFSDNLPGPGRGAASHYPCMSLPDLMRFPLPPLARDAWLFLWRVGSMQAEALDVCRAWGFGSPVSEFVWVKTTLDGSRPAMGMGRSVRNAHEVCLVAKRGRPVRLSAAVRSVFSAPRMRHSAKPDVFYEQVEALAPGPYYELFARRKRDGWTCEGNEVAA